MPSNTTVSWPKLVGTAAYLLAWPTLQLWLSGSWRWVEGWIFGVWFIALCASSIGWLYRKDPALLAERYRKPGTGGQSRADALIVFALLIGFIVWIVLPSLDARRFGWTPRLPPWLEAAGYFGFSSSSTLGTPASPRARYP